MIDDLRGLIVPPEVRGGRLCSVQGILVSSGYVQPPPPPPAEPDIVVTGNGVSIADGDATPSAGDHTDFGQADQGAAPVVFTYAIANPGGATLTLGTPTVPTGFTLVTAPSGSVLAGGSTSMVVRLDTATIGVKTGEISFSTNVTGKNPFNYAIRGEIETPPPPPGSPDITVTGNGVSIADGDSTPSSGDHTDFGTVTEGGSPQYRTFTISNPGTADLVLGTPTVPTGFTLTSAPAMTVAPSASTQLIARLDTTTVGAKTGEISVSTNVSGKNPYNFAVAGNVDAAPAPGAVFETFTIVNDDASATGANWVSQPFASTFKPGDIPTGYYPRFQVAGGGAVLDYSYWNKATHEADGSWRAAGFMLRLPTSLASGASVSIEISAVNTAPSSTSRALTDISARDFKVKGNGRYQIAQVEWTSSVNTGITDDDEVYEFTRSDNGRGGGNVCRYWRIGQGFRNGSTEDLGPYIWFYIFVIENSAGGLYGFRVTPVLSYPFADGYPSEPRAVVFDDLAFYDGATLIQSPPLPPSFDFTRMAEIHGSGSGSQSNGTYYSYDVDYSSKVGTLVRGHVLTGPGGVTAGLLTTPTGATGTIQFWSTVDSPYSSGDTLTNGSNSITITGSLRKCVAFSYPSADYQYRPMWGKVSNSGGALPTGLSASGTYACRPTAGAGTAKLWFSEDATTGSASYAYGTRVATTDAGTGTHTFTPLPVAMRGHQLLITGTNVRELFVAGGGTGSAIISRALISKSYLRKSGGVYALPDSVTGMTANPLVEYRWGQHVDPYTQYDESKTGPSGQIGVMHDQDVKDFVLRTATTRQNALMSNAATMWRSKEILDRTTRKHPVAIGSFTGLGPNWQTRSYLDATQTAGWRWGVVYDTTYENMYRQDRFHYERLDHINPVPQYAYLMTGRAEFLDACRNGVAFEVIASNYVTLWNETTHSRNFTHPYDGSSIVGFPIWYQYQIRDMAWGLRDMMKTVMMLPQTDPYYSYLYQLYKVVFEASAKFRHNMSARQLATGWPHWIRNRQYRVPPFSHAHWGGYSGFTDGYVSSIIPWCHKAMPLPETLIALEQDQKKMGYWRGISKRHFYGLLDAWYFIHFTIWDETAGKFGYESTDDAQIGNAMTTTASWDATANTVTFPYLNGHASGQDAYALDAITTGDRISFGNAYGIGTRIPGTNRSTVYYVEVVSSTTNSFTLKLYRDAARTDLVDITGTGSSSGVQLLGVFQNDNPIILRQFNGDMVQYLNYRQSYLAHRALGFVYPTTVVDDFAAIDAAVGINTLIAASPRFAAAATWE